MPFSDLQMDAYSAGGPMSGRNMRADEAMYDAKNDFKQHRAYWRSALELARDNCHPVLEPEKREHWEEELKVFDRVFATLSQEFK